MDSWDKNEEEPATDFQEVLSVFSALGGSEVWQLFQRPRQFIAAKWFV